MTQTRDDLRTITIGTESAKAACVAIGRAICASDFEDCRTWHGGLGDDVCDYCEALVFLRAAAGYTPIDHLRA